MTGGRNESLVDGHFAIGSLVDLDRLRGIFVRFTEATGFTIGFLDHPSLNILAATGWRDICTKFHRSCPAAAEICTRSNRRLLDALTVPHEVMIEACDHGLIDCAVPIVINGKHIASLATGQLLLEAPDLRRFEEQARRYGFDVEAYLAALAEVPVVSAATLRSTTLLLGEIASIIAELGHANLVQRQETRKLQEETAERKKAEAVRQQLEEQLRVSQKLEAIGSLAGGVAHDFNNLLSVIVGHTDFAMASLRDGSPLKDHLLEVRRAGERAAALTRQLLAFSRTQKIEPVQLDLNQAARGLEKMLRWTLGPDIDLGMQFAPDLGLTLADPGQVEQVLMNLVGNARDAMPEGGKLTIETSNVQVDVDAAARLGAVAPGTYVQLSVTDTGCGMDAQTRTRIFEPFFTTKEKGKGTGLGLSTVYGIVKQSGGNIWVDSQPGRGTTFKLYWPLSLSASAAPAIQSTSVPKPGPGTETILVVEDEEAVRDVAARSLEAVGYRVLAAADGDSALLTSAQHAGDIHLLLADVVMPRMSGKALAQELSRTRPAIKVLYMSGYAGDAIVHHGVRDAGTQFLGKPFTAAELARKVRVVLDEGSPRVAGGRGEPTKE